MDYYPSRRPLMLKIEAESKLIITYGLRHSKLFNHSENNWVEAEDHFEHKDKIKSSEIEEGKCWRKNTAQ